MFGMVVGPAGAAKTTQVGFQMTVSASQTPFGPW